MSKDSKVTEYEVDSLEQRAGRGQRENAGKENFLYKL